MKLGWSHTVLNIQDKEKILDRYKPSKYLVGEVSPSMIEYLLEHFRGSRKNYKI